MRYLSTSTYSLVLLSSHKHISLIRLCICTLLLVLICFKASNLIYSYSSGLKKEINNNLADSNEEETQKQAEKVDSEKEFFIISNTGINQYRHVAQHVHISAYLINYISSYVVSIALPPPDTF